MSMLSVHWEWLLAILGMGLATYATRLSGLLLMRGIEVKGRMKAALDALPPSVLMAVITPTVLMTGRAESLAAIITAIAAIMRLPLLATMVIGIGSVWLLKILLG
ncbi:AzlD family protein [Aestuariivirga litoralis]|uniref:AzlD family protein n=1 Tax=Aestuariivirga litoralis TaxID=2650924 RepID=UPI001FEDE5FB|nr:AzlD domain-containing protein [Aestuariivirga litoralis]